MYLKLVCSSGLAFITLFAMTKLMGKRQISQLNFFDYISGISIGNIAAEMALSTDADIVKPLIALAIFTVFAVLISLATCKSIKLRKFFSGQPEFLISEGKISEKQLRSARLDLDELLSQARINGYYDISQIESATLETNGTISFQPKAGYRPVNCSDIQIQPPKDSPLTAVILDGNVMSADLQRAGYNEAWLKKQLEAQNADIKDTLLAVCDSGGRIVVYKKSSSS